MRSLRSYYQKSYRAIRAQGHRLLSKIISCFVKEIEHYGRYKNVNVFMNHITPAALSLGLLIKDHEHPEVKNGKLSYRKCA